MSETNELTNHNPPPENLTLTPAQITVARFHLERLAGLLDNQHSPVSPILKGMIAGMVKDYITGLSDEQVTLMVAAFFDYSDFLTDELWPDEKDEV